MRDLVLGGILAWLMFMALRRPWIGIMGWTWVSIMNPHQLTWALRTMPIAMMMVAAIFVGMVFTRDKRNFFLTRESVVLIIFMIWMCITLPFSMFLDASLPLWSRVMKIDFMILVAMILLHSRQHIMVLCYVLVGSLAFYGIKGGLFTIATGGSYRVWGPENSYIEGNNEVALALVMIIPLMRFLQLQAKNKWLRRGLMAGMLLCAAAALGSQSRGALLAIVAMTVMLWLRGENKLRTGLILLAVGVALVLFMPDTWTNRMNTIGTYKQDDSALGRINAWWMAFNLANHNLFGGGFMIYNVPTFAQYAPDPTDVHAAHSIYFMVLGEQGWIGLFLFLLLGILIWSTAGKLRVAGARQPETRWLSDLGAMCQVSLAGYAVGGAFLSLSYWDFPYNVLILVVIGQRWLASRGWEREDEQGRALPLTRRGVT